MIEVGIIGGAGYTAGELIRILLDHPKTTINFVYSTSNAGNKISAVHQDLYGDTDLLFSDHNAIQEKAETTPGADRITERRRKSCHCRWYIRNCYSCYGRQDRNRD